MGSDVPTCAAEAVDGFGSTDLSFPPETQTVVSRSNLVVRHYRSKACEFEPHFHSWYTVTAVFSGTLQGTIGDAKVKLGAGETALTNAGVSHSALGRDVEFVSIGISPGIVNELVADLGLMRSNPEIAFRSRVVDDDPLMKIARAIAVEIRDEKVGRGAMLDVLVRQLVIHLLRSHMTVRKTAHIELSRVGPVDRRLRRAIEFMHDNYSRDLILEEIASAAYLSEYHFARLFKQTIGSTPHVYLANLRLERARKLLAETTLPISQIASQVGYQSQSHFTKMFKAVAGVTPRVYRESSRG